MKLKALIPAAALAILAACGTPYRATDESVVMTPTYTLNAFNHQYPGAINVVWSNYDATMTTPIDWELAGWTVLDPSDYTVRFDLDNESYYAWYNDKGDWIGTAYMIRDYNTMPAAVMDAVHNQFPDYTIVNANREFQTDRIAYEVVLKNSDTKVKVLMDPNGNIIRQKNKPLY